MALRTSLILVVEFHAVCRCTICGAQADSEARIPVIAMTARVDIFTKAVTSRFLTLGDSIDAVLCPGCPTLSDSCVVRSKDRHVQYFSESMS